MRIFLLSIFLLFIFTCKESKTPKKNIFIFTHIKDINSDTKLFLKGKEVGYVNKVSNFYDYSFIKLDVTEDIIIPIDSKFILLVALVKINQRDKTIQ